MTKRPKDLNQLAKLTVDLATGSALEDPEAELTDLQRFAQAGGRKGGKARAEKLSPERRKEIARNAAAARWGKPTKGDPT